MTLKTLLGDYPVTRHFKDTARGYDFAGGFKLPQQAFKRVVRDLEFDFAELAIVTFLLAKAHGKPYRLLPTVLTARFQHPYLVRLSSKPLSPRDLNGRTIGQRSYSVTTATWIRGMLMDEGVDLGSIRWVTFEDPHVAEFRDPANVVKAGEGKEITAMLLAGELDAAIVGEVPDDPRLACVWPDPAAAADEWRRKHGAIQLNHLTVVRKDMPWSLSDEIFRLLKQSREAAGSPAMNPFGVEENRKNLEAAVDCVYAQGMIPRRFTVEELFE